MVRSIGVLWLAFAIVAGCSKPAPQQTAAPKQDILVADMDTSVNPGDDFFAYANGGWLKRNPIPASESAWGIGNVVRDELYDNSARSTKLQPRRTAPPAQTSRKSATSGRPPWTKRRPINRV